MHGLHHLLRRKRAAEPPVSLVSPYAFGDRLPLDLMVPGRGQWGGDDLFLRVDLYPRARPLTRERHYGFWDIPLAWIDAERTRAVLDLARGELLVQAADGTEQRARGWCGKLEESGLCLAHLSLWEGTPDAAVMRETHAYPLLRHGGNFDTPLKQIHIPVTDRCNLACPMCPRTSARYAPSDDMAEGVFEALLDEAAQVPCIMIMALGEPLLHPGIMDVVRRCRARLPAAGEVGITTNATLLDGLTARALLEAGLGFLYCSVDGATKATYETTRIGADFETTCANIQRFTGLRRSLASPCRVMMNFVIMDSNVHEIPDLVHLAARLGVEHVTFSHQHGLPSDDLNRFGETRLAALLEGARQAAHAHGVHIDLPRVKRTEVERCFCTERVLTSPDGGVYPCPMLQPGYHPAGLVKNFGNVRERPLRAIWESADYRAFRRAVNTSAFPPECAGCGFKSYLTP